MNKISITLEHYNHLLDNLIVLQNIAELIIEYEKHNHYSLDTLNEISKLVSNHLKLNL